MTPDAGGSLPGQHLVTLKVAGHPASYSTAATGPWRNAVRAAVASSGVTPPLVSARFAVGMAFRTRVPLTVNEVWDLDNLIKPTLDALDGVFGLRQWKGPVQAADDRVDHLSASKRTVEACEQAGATISIHLLDAEVRSGA